MRIKLFLGLLVALWVAPSLPAQTNRPAAPLLWRIEGPKPSYVFGTIHLSDPSVARITPAVARAVAGVDALFCEIAMEPTNLLGTARLMMSERERLSEVLPAELRAEAEAELKRVAPVLGLEAFDSMKVWAFAMTLVLVEEQLKNPLGKPLDLLLYESAQKLGKSTGGLETPAEQVGAMDALTPAEQIEMLRSTLRGMAEARREGRALLGELREAYLSGDLGVLQRTMDRMTAGDDAKLRDRFLDLLLVQRNRRMAERMTARLKAEPGRGQFFAVGAAHLEGREGVLELLRKAGHRLTRVQE